MEHGALFYLFIILFTAKIFSNLFSKLNQPPVLGEIFAGVLLGQSVLGLVPIDEMVKFLAELGVILLLFQVGLESDLNKLIKVGFYALVVAFIGAFTPMIIGTLACYYLFNLPFHISLFIGGTLTATSIGLTVRVLEDLGKMKERFAQIVLGAAVLDDIIGVIVLAGLIGFIRKNVVEISVISKLIIVISLFFIFSPFISQIIFKFINRISQKLKMTELTIGLIISFVFLISYISKAIDAPEILGAFVAGLALSKGFEIPGIKYFKPDEQLSETIHNILNPLVLIFTPLFFAYVGIQLNLKAIDFVDAKFWVYSLVILAIAIFGKVVSGFFVNKATFNEKLLIGFSMLPRGEVGLIFAEYGRINKIYDDFLYAVIIFVVAFTTFMAPIFLKALVKK